MRSAPPISAWPIPGRSRPRKRAGWPPRTRWCWRSAAASTPSEIGATQAANELLYTLATATDPPTLDVLQNVIIILIPSLNPDGHRLVVDWYEHAKGTPFEGGPMPWLYHKYAGHDINRDAFMMNMRGEPQPRAVLLHRVASAGLPDHAPDGPNGAADSSCRRMIDPIDAQLRPADLARSGAARRRHGVRAPARSPHRRAVERHVRLLLAGVRGLGAARAQHRLPVDRGRRASRSPRRSRGRQPICTPARKGCPSTSRRSIFPTRGRAAPGRFGTSSTTT